MIRLARLLVALESSSSPEALLLRHLRDLPDTERVWTAALLSGQAPRRLIAPAALRALVTKASGLPPWLVDTSLAVAGDLAEAAAHLLPAPQTPRDLPLAEAMASLADLALLDAKARDAKILALWADLPPAARVPLNRLLTGSWGAGLGPGPVARALAAITGQDPAPIAQRLAGQWSPVTTRLADLIRADNTSPRPLPMPAPERLVRPPHSLGPAQHWLVTHWPGDLRAQAMIHHGQASLWSPCGAPLTARFPDLVPLVAQLPDGTVIDAVVLGRDPETGLLLPPESLKRRLSGKAPSLRALAVQALLVALDLPVLAGKDLRARPLADRLDLLAGLCATLSPDAPMRMAQGVAAADWPARDMARTGALLLRRRDAPYRIDPDDDWLLWPPAQKTFRAVLVYARAAPDGTSECTFALRDATGLVPIARATPGLAPPEAAALSAWLRGHTQDRFGPVRQVAPSQVFELAFDSVERSPRHKAGLALRGVRVLRWDRGADPADIAALSDLRALAGG